MFVFACFLVCDVSSRPRSGAVNPVCLFSSFAPGEEERLPGATSEGGGGGGGVMLMNQFSAR